jgi:hypothetical protein
LELLATLNYKGSASRFEEKKRPQGRGGPGSGVFDGKCGQKCRIFVENAAEQLRIAAAAGGAAMYD